MQCAIQIPDARLAPQAQVLFYVCGEEMGIWLPLLTYDMASVRTWLCRRQWLDAAHGTTAGAEMLAAAAAEEAAAAAALGVRRVGAVEDLRCLDENLDTVGRRWVLQL